MPPPPYAPVILKLLKGVIYRDDPYWDRLQNYLEQIKAYFGQIGLRVRNHEADGFPYLEQPDPDPDDPGEALPRLTVRHKLSVKVTIFCVLLREQWRQFDASDATGKLVLSIEKIRDLLKLYVSDGNNEEKIRDEIDRLVNRLIELGFLKRLSEQERNYEVRPILKAKIDAEMLERLREKLETYANPASSTIE